MLSIFHRTSRPLLTLALCAAALGSAGCDPDDIDTDADAEADDDSDIASFRAGTCGPPPSATKWRIRNASAQDDSGQWSFRELAFCADAACSQRLTGTAIDSDDSPTWAEPANAFDGDTNTLWKSFDADVAGQSWIGLDFGAPTGVHGVYLKTDNVVYSVDDIYVEYYDSNLAEWVTADFLGDVPAASELSYEVRIRDRFPVQWRVRNAAVQANSGQWVLREMDFCADAACTTALADGTAIDSDDSPTWAEPANAFDDDTNTLWKSFDADITGQSWIGMDYGSQITEIHGLYLKTDNVVYSVDTIYVEYFDVVKQAWIASDYLTDVPSGSELTYAVENRKRFPTRWRVRNAVAQANSGQWVLREMDFCADATCTTALSGGTAFDSGASKSWSLPANAFDNNTTTMWKTFDTNVAGQSYLGMDYDDLTDIAGVYLKTDNVVYSVNTIHVEYYDIVAGQWVTADTLGNVPAASQVTRALAPCG